MTPSLYDPLVAKEAQVQALLIVLKSSLGNAPQKYIEKLNNASKETIENILGETTKITSYDDIEKFLK